MRVVFLCAWSGFYSKVTACDISGCRRQPLISHAAIPPTIANGKVYVGTTNGVAVFGLSAKVVTQVKV